MNEEEANEGGILSGNGVAKMLYSMEMQMIHEYVISNFVAIEAFYRYH
jgi:hypothetical protein